MSPGIGCGPDLEIDPQRRRQPAVPDPPWAGPRQTLAAASLNMHPKSIMAGSGDNAELEFWVAAVGRWRTGVLQNAD